MTPRISVIIPAYNAEAFLAEAIRSALEQSLTPLEIFVVDDGSTDGTAEIAKSFGSEVILLQQSNQGTAAARNLAIPQVRGEFIALLDADDIMVSTRLESQANALVGHPEFDLVFGEKFIFDHGDDPLTLHRAANMNEDGTIVDVRCASQQERISLVPGAMLCRTNVFSHIGLFAPEFRLGEFFDWFARVEDAGILSARINEVVLYRRRHENNLSRRGRAGYAMTLKAILDRRRAA